MILPNTPADQAEAHLIVRWSEQAQVPSWVVQQHKQWQLDRKYLAEEMLHADDPNRVAVPALYRGILSKVSLLRAENPDPVVKRLPLVEPTPGDPREPLWRQFVDAADQTGRTASLVLRAWARDENLDRQQDRMLLEALTTGVAWIKTGFQEDAGRDPLGRAVRHRGARDQMIRLRRLAREYESGLWGDDDGRHAELVALSDYARAQVPKEFPGDPRSLALQQTLAGQPVMAWMVPEPQVWRGGVCGMVDPENIRIDTKRVVSPETLHLGRFIQERVWMTRDEVVERFNLTEDEQKMLGAPWSATSIGVRDTSWNVRQGDDPMETDLDAQVRLNGEEIAIWERWDLELGQVAWWTQGITRILDRQFLDAQTKRGHPYICFIPNPVAGRFLGHGDVALGRKEQDAMNQALTDDWEARIASYPFYACIRGLLSDESKDAIRKRVPNAIVELEEHIQVIKEQMEKFPGEPYDAARFAGAFAQSQRNLELALGMPTEAMQGVNRNLKYATQAQIQADNLSAQMQRVAAMALDVRRQVLDDWLQYGLACLSPEEAKRIAGPFAVWPMLDRDTLARYLTVEVTAAPNRTTRSADLEDLGVALDAMAKLLQARAAGLAQGLALPVQDLERRITAGLDLRLPGPLLQAIDPRMLAAANGGGIPAGGAPAGGQPGGQPQPGPAPAPAPV